MPDALETNWDIRTTKIELRDWNNSHRCIEDFHASPDGEKLCAITNDKEGDYRVCINGQPWGKSYIKAWNLCYSPKGQLSAIVYDGEKWTIAVDEKEWNNKFDYVWNTTFNSDGSKMAVAFQNDSHYGMAVNDDLWSKTYINISAMTISDNGLNTAASVQTKAINEGDVKKFQEGAFTAAINADAWDSSYVNCWDLQFDSQGRNLAACVRKSLYEYTIAINGELWNKSFACVWKPMFNPVTNHVVVAVRDGQRWTIAKNGAIIWKNRFAQLWQPCFSNNGEKLAAIVAPSFGKWAIAVNDQIFKFGNCDKISCLTFSPDSSQFTAIIQKNRRQTLIFNSKRCNRFFDRVWPPVFSNNSKHVAAKIENKGLFSIAMDGKLPNLWFDKIWDPVFSPGSDTLMIRGIRNNIYYRQILPLEQFRE